MSYYLPNLSFRHWPARYTYPPEYTPIPAAIEHIYVTMLARMVELANEQKDTQTPANPQPRSL